MSAQIDSSVSEPTSMRKRVGRIPFIPSLGIPTKLSLFAGDIVPSGIGPNAYPVGPWLKQQPLVQKGQKSSHPSNSHGRSQKHHIPETTSFRFKKKKKKNMSPFNRVAYLLSRSTISALPHKERTERLAAFAGACFTCIDPGSDIQW